MLFRCTLSMLWGVTILLLTCVSDFFGLLQMETIQIRWTWHPEFSQLLQIPKTLEQSYLLQKCGHILAFLILTIVVPKVTRKTGVYLILFAFLTELLQLYFGRSGRFLDVGYDTMGILLGLFISQRAIPFLLSKNRRIIEV